MESLSASRIGCFLSCPRKHYYAYELGIEKEEASLALRFGSAFHKALECRSNGATIEEAYEKATKGREIDEPIELAKLYGLLSGYYQYYVDGNEIIDTMCAECQFTLPIPSSRTFYHYGVIDGLAVRKDRRLALVEHKTTGEDINPASDYWTKVTFNQQLLLYVMASRAMGWDIDTVIYDVIRKPAIRQRTNESVEEYGERLAKDTLERPEFYFQRKEIYILDSAIEEFAIQRDMICKMLLHCRASQKRVSHPEQAWARNVNGFTCKTCEFAPFCLQCIHIDKQSIPSGFQLKKPISVKKGENQTNN